MTARSWRVVVRLAIVAMLGAAEARQVDMFEPVAVMESLSAMPRWRQIRWLREQGLPDPMLRPATVGTDSGLSVVGRWSYGPARSIDLRVTDADTVAFLSRGSGVTVARVRTADSLSLQLLSDINCVSLTGRVMASDSLLCVGSGGVEIYDIRDLARPALLGRLSAAIYDFWVQDTLLYTVGPESLKVYSTAVPSSPRLVGASRDSGFVMCVSGRHAYLGHSAGLYVIDITDPAHPTRIATIGADASAITARDTFLYVGTTGQELRVYSVANPAQPRFLGSLGGVQTTHLCLPQTCDTVVYSPWLQAISVADPAHPRLLGTVTCPGWDYWVAALPTLDYALVADYFEGLVAVDISNPAAPVVAGQWWAADEACDIDVQHGVACVAETKAGVRFFDVSEPATPLLLGGVDTLFDGVRCYSAALHDSFAFASYYYPWFRSVDVSDPANPRMAGGCYPPTEYLQALSVRDSFVYAALHYQFHVLNVARPREPRVVGTVNLPGMSREVILSDTLAFVAGQGMHVISVANPTSPRIIGLWDRYARGIDLQDTILYAVTYTNSTEDVLVSLDVTNPASPAVVDSVIVPRTMHDVLVVDTVAYCVGWEVQLASVADPANLRLLPGRWSPPSWVRRVIYGPPYIYMCATDAGVSIFETLSVGVGESRAAARRVSPFSVTPTVTRGIVRLAAAQSQGVNIALADASGRVLWRRQSSAQATLDLTGLPDGVYFVSLAGQATALARVTKVTGR